MPPCKRSWPPILWWTFQERALRPFVGHHPMCVYHLPTWSCCTYMTRSPRLFLSVFAYYKQSTTGRNSLGTWEYVTCDHSALLHTSVVQMYERVHCDRMSHTPVDSVVYNVSLITLRVLLLLSLQSSDVSDAGPQSMHWLIGECSGIQTSRIA